MHGGKGAAGMPLISVRVVWVCVCAKEERGTVYDEAFPRQHCQTELRRLFDGAAGSHVTCLPRYECVLVGVYAMISESAEKKICN